MFEISLRLRFLAEFLHLRNVPSPAGFSLAHTGGPADSQCHAEFVRAMVDGRTGAFQDNVRSPKSTHLVRTHARTIANYNSAPGQHFCARTSSGISVGHDR